MKLSTRLSAVLVTGLLVSQISHANELNTKEIGHRCMDTAYQLNKLAETHHGDRCAGDIEIASAYIEAAGNEIFQEKNEQALRSITYGEYELNQISRARPYCARIAPQTKTFLARVITLKSEIEMMGFKHP